MNLRDLRTSAPGSLKVAGRHAALMLGRSTSGLRMLPDFILAGASRSGTTSLHRALITHPAVVAPVLNKGVHYFDVGYTHDVSWYRGHFPIRRIAELRARSAPPLAFESSGYYMHHPVAPDRIAAAIPSVKIIVMIRDPVERAFSAYKHESARGFEDAGSFEQALELEAGRLEGEVERLRSDPRYISLSHRHQSYADRGRYAGQIRHLFELFGRDRVHVLFSEDFFATPESEYEKVLTFLGLPIVHAPAYEQHNARRSSRMNEYTRTKLTEHFDPFDQDLADLLGTTAAWRR